MLRNQLVHLRRWALIVLALAVIGFGVAACNPSYSSPGSNPGNGTPAPTSPSGY